ncbi:hypothetical protein HU200_005081 [Digitaria exilis]|uniref:Uncharacterized protein n=1 Tax=Digitaria exilis TaxID=1010633 RepID=A0A835FTK0_9POAL|nr:hypothetical protein HU200_005081 [Digitaria exilis]
MHRLRYLKISGSRLTNKSLAVILDNCPQLESIDLSCLNIVIDDVIQAKYDAIKISSSPTDGHFLINDGYGHYWSDRDDWESESGEDDFDPY